MKLSITFLFIYLSLLLYTNGSVIIDSIEGHCEIISSTTPCKDILNYNSIYIPSNTNQSTIEARVNFTIANLTLTPTSCQEVGQVFACLRNYQPCISINSTTPIVPVPSFPCRDTCYKFMNQCSFWVLIKDPTFTCDSDSFPQTSTSYNVSFYGGPINETVQCNSGEGANTENIIETPCYSPLITMNNTDADGLYYYVAGSCTLPCPFQIFTDSQEKTFNGLMAIYVISFICSVYLLITFGLVSNDFTNKSEIVLYYAVGNIIFSLQYFISEASGEFRCSNSPGRYKSQQFDWICAFMGVFLQFGALLMFFGFTAFSFDFFLIIRRKANSYFKYQRIVMFVVLIVLTLVPLIAGKYETTLGTNSCWLSNRNDRISTVYQYVFFYVPALVSLVLMVFFTITSIYKISAMYRVTPNKDILYYNMKMATFLILILFVFVMFLAFKFYTDQGRYREVIGDWVKCLYANQGDVSSCKEIQLPGMDLKFVQNLSVALVGIIGVYGYGSDRSIIKIYTESRKIRFILSLLGKNLGNLSSSSSSNTPNEATYKGSRSVKLKSMTGQASSSGSESGANTNTITESSVISSSNTPEEQQQ